MGAHSFATKDNLTRNIISLIKNGVVVLKIGKAKDL
jgi:hypothetical protein